MPWRVAPQTQPAMEMTKWFDTNYHYIVPEFNADTRFRIASPHLFREVAEAQALGISPKAVLIGPLTYLYLGKESKPGFSRLDLLPRLLPVYREILAQLASLGVEWVQIDEPLLALDLEDEWLHGLDQAYASLTESELPKLLLTTYFEAVHNHATRLKKLPVDGLHIDLCRAPDQLEFFSTAIQPRKCCPWASLMGAIYGVPILRERSRRCHARKRSWARDYGLRRVVLFCIARLISSWRHGWMRKSRAGWRSRSRS